MEKKEQAKRWIDYLDNLPVPKGGGLLDRLAKKDKALSEFYDLQNPFRQGFMLAEDIVKTWAEENYPIGNNKSDESPSKEQEEKERLPMPEYRLPKQKPSSQTDAEEEDVKVEAVERLPMSAVMDRMETRMLAGIDKALRKKDIYMPKELDRELIAPILQEAVNKYEQEKRESVEITPEILEQYGFARLWHLNQNEYTLPIDESINTIHFSFPDDKPICILSLTEDNYDENIGVGSFTAAKVLPIKYVHELENLYLLLTGKFLQTPNNKH